MTHVTSRSVSRCFDNLMGFIHVAWYPEHTRFTKVSDASLIQKASLLGYAMYNLIVLPSLRVVLQAPN